MSNNDSLSNARAAKKDEFYTQLSDIENECSHYIEHFKGKTILCNCDDPFESNFFKYFALNFNAFGLKKLIATCYDGSPVMGSQLNIFDESHTGRKAFKIEITEVKDYTGSGSVDLSDVKYLIQNDKNVLTMLDGNGDFRSAECVELLKEADVVVTNPPFSLFRDYVKQLVEYDKKFLIIGNQNAITYKEVFPLIRENKIWLGYGFSRGNAYFSVAPEAAQNYAKGVYDEATGLVKFRNCCWFTNLDIKKLHEELILYRHYTPEEYPRYDNYDAIEVSKTADIPCDYDGVMGVPITFLDKYCPEQFEIASEYNGGLDSPALRGNTLYKRIFIRRRRWTLKSER